MTVPSAQIEVKAHKNMQFWYYPSILISLANSRLHSPVLGFILNKNDQKRIFYVILCAHGLLGESMWEILRASANMLYLTIMFYFNTPL